MARSVVNEITIECKDCGKKFTLTTEEQDWYRSKGFDLPKRCLDCRKRRKIERR